MRGTLKTIRIERAHMLPLKCREAFSCTDCGSVAHHATSDRQLNANLLKKCNISECVLLEADLRRWSKGLTIGFKFSLWWIAFVGIFLANFSLELEKTRSHLPFIAMKLLPNLRRKEAKFKSRHPLLSSFLGLILGKKTSAEFICSAKSIWIRRPLLG